VKAYRTLVLNADFIPLHLVPLSTVPWQDAMVLIFQGKATAIQNYSDFARTPNTEYKIPSVIVLKNYKHFNKKAKLNKFNIKLRDEFTCQYCGKVHSHKALTIDHVMPKSKGGKNSWDNLVTACKPCNHSKKNKSYSPLKKPVAPTYFDLAKKLYKYESVRNNDWLPYLRF
jgi:5-methylcytosine-specific restriction endonuclease McrA